MARCLRRSALARFTVDRQRPDARPSASAQGRELCRPGQRAHAGAPGNLQPAEALRLDARCSRQPFWLLVDTESPESLQSEVYRRQQTAPFVDRMLAYDWRFTLSDNDLPKVSGTTRLAGIDVGYPLLVRCARRRFHRARHPGQSPRTSAAALLQGIACRLSSAGDHCQEEARLRAAGRGLAGEGQGISGTGSFVLGSIDSNGA